MKNPIIEIICQITFDSDTIKNWDSRYHYSLFDKIKSEFPNASDDKQFNFRIDLDNETQRIQHTVDEEVIHKFSSEDSQKSILFCNKFCNFSLRLDMGHDYKNWQADFLPHFEKLWHNLQSIIPFDSFYSLGIRYVNKIIPSDFGLKLTDIVKQENDYLPKVALNTLTEQEYVTHLQLSQGINKKIVINSAYQRDSNAIILDIDAINEYITLSCDSDVITVANDIQKRIEHCFFNIISPTLAQKIRG